MVTKTRWFAHEAATLITSEEAAKKHDLSTIWFSKARKHKGLPSVKEAVIARFMMS